MILFLNLGNSGPASLTLAACVSTQAAFFIASVRRAYGRRNRLA